MLCLGLLLFLQYFVPKLNIRTNIIIAIFSDEIDNLLLLRYSFMVFLFYFSLLTREIRIIVNIQLESIWHYLFKSKA